jgi:adenylosuccinate synthase
LARGDKKHGSCGHGFNECIERSQLFPITVSELHTITVEQLRVIRNDWVIPRLADITIPQDYQKLIFDDSILEQFVLDCKSLAERISLVHDSEISKLAKDIIFEGAQGLLLDQRSEYFPHVTRSNTGLLNVESLMGVSNIEKVNPIYLTRCYVTRHGAGPLPNEMDISDVITVIDETNKPNPWQETLRFAPLDKDYLAQNIRRDLKTVSSNIIGSVIIGLSCLDQITNHIVLNEEKVYRDDVGGVLKASLGFDVIESYGPTRGSIIHDEVDVEIYENI